jgi:hypothetical protein
MKAKRVWEILDEKLSPSEAIYGFAGWLTGRKDKTIMSSSDDAAAIADLVDKFNKKQGLEEPREHWEKDLIPMNESLGYTDFFGNNVSHKNAIQRRIRDLIIQIAVEERGISEKSFEAYDKVIEEVQELCSKNPSIYEKAEDFYQRKQRLELAAEEIYNQYFIS